ncbi:MAG: redoxin family protein [Planctomycetes bacterium]|nr:redoxin family protein [Planctomycetota bacterium]
MLTTRASLTFLVAVFCTGAGLPRVVGADDAPAVAVGVTIPNLNFKDIRFVSRSLADLGTPRAYVLVFTNTTCPVAQKYWPKLKRLEADWRSKGVLFVAINSAADDSIAEVAEQALEFGVEFPFVKDLDGSCAKAVGIRRTPEVAVLDADKRLRYRGRIDDQYRIGGARPAVQHEDLRDALEAVLEGREPADTVTPVEGCLLTFPATAARNEVPTFTRDVLPILQKHCQECHHDGSSAAPFSLMTSDDALRHAAMIGEVVAEQRMPPWRASRRQHFSNERGLSRTERRVIAAWLQGGTPVGDPADAPPARTFVTSKWEIGEPDQVLTAIETHSLPAEGIIDYRYVVLPYVFPADTWICAAEILPDNPRTVHHCNMAFFTLGQQFSEGNFITGRVPGGTALIADEGQAIRIPKGSVIGLQAHYTTTGKPEKNRMSVGFRFPRGVIHKEIHHLQVSTSKIAIPPGAAAHPVVSSRTLPCQATGIGMFSHMHLRGKDMTFIAHTPDGQSETLLTIPNYHYAWQQNYRWEPGSKTFPAGTRIEVIAHYDNSAFNPFNPDPQVVVRAGPQTFHEMMFGFFFYTNDGEDLKLQVDSKTGRALPQANPAAQPGT